MITSAQLRSARHALRWSVKQLSERSGVSGSTIKRFEAIEESPSITKANCALLKSTLEAAGIEFIGTPDDAPGIRIHAPKE